MSSIGSPSPFFLAGKKAYEVERSLRFNRSDDAYLQATLGNSNLNKWTLSIWVKKAVNGEHQAILSSGDSSVSTMVNFGNNDRLKFTNYPGSSAGIYITTRKFRDPSAWYHIVAIWDSGNSTAGDRIRLYVNGVRETAFDQSDNPNQNQNSVINGNTQGDSTWGQGKHRIGRYSNYADNSGCYYAEVNFVDGQAYDPSYFAETDALTGQWNPKKYVGSYGTNGFYLNFSDNSGTSSTTLGKDSSGNGNNFTPNNLAVSDAMPDTPTNNFATMNPLNGYSGLSEGNLRFNFYNDSAGNRSTQATIALPKSGKWYWEARYQESGTGTVTTKYFGLSQIHMATGYVTAPYVYYDGGTGVLRNGNASDNVDGKQVWYNGTGVPALLGIAVDVDNNSVEYFHNGSSQGTIPLPTLTSSQEYFFTWANTSGGSSSTLNDTFNFGADSTFQGQASSGGNTDANGVGDFKYAPPSGHLALCSANLPDPTIKLPNKHFAAFTYTGTGSSGDVVNITNSDVDFTPDWVWVKSRATTNNHILTDAVRGGSKYLVSSETNAEVTDTDTVRDFLQGGFESGTDGDTNWPSRTFVAWNWNAGDTDGKTYTVKVVSDGGNKYRFDDFGTSAVTLDLAEGGTYIFDQSDNSNASHPLRFSTTSNGTHAGGSEYTTGVTTVGTPGQAGSYTQIVVAASAPTLYYYCTNHSGMGGQANTNSTLGSSNFDGTIQATVKANTTAGFSIVTYTGNGSSGATIGHGLGIAPDVVIIKRRDGSNSWQVFHQSTGAGKFTDISSTSAVETNSNRWNDTAPTSTVITLGNNSNVNSNNGTCVGYVFSEVAGYSKFGKYTGNGSSNGTFIFTGFSPAFIMVKRTDSSNMWLMMDNKRYTHNVHGVGLKADTAEAEFGWNPSKDFLSNGFKIRTSDSAENANNATYIYFAFAESPFKNSRAR